MPFNRVRSSSWASPVAGGFAAALAAGAGMVLLRLSLSVRTLPERLMESALLLVSPDFFESALQRFGFDAKRYALYTAIGGMLLVLTALGAIVLRRRWPPSAIVGLGLGLWLLTMVVIMPLTGAGVFASGLIDGTRAAVGGYLSVALTYVATLALMRTLVRSVPPAPVRTSARPGGVPAARSVDHAKRSALALLGTAVASFAATFVLVRLGPKSLPPTRVVVLDPQEPMPAGKVDLAPSHPNLVTTPATVSSGGSAPGPTSVPPAAAPASTATRFPEPPPPRQLKRDKDGAVLPSARRPGDASDLITATDDFYVVTKNAAGDPLLRALDWRLQVDGDVERAFDLDYASLRNLPSVQVTKTLECISNLADHCELAPFGCDLISTARWQGVRMRDVLELAGSLRPGVESLSIISADEFTSALPIEVALAPDTLLVYEMNGQILSREHGYPVRVLVPGRYGMKSAKWVVGLRPLRGDYVDWYGQRNWSKQGLVQTMTRIDMPARGAELPPGAHRIAGIAYAGDRGIVKVEYSRDDGKSWELADLMEPPPDRDTWVRWQGHFTLRPGAEVSLVARATDGTGALQTEEFRLAQPDGSSGWHHVTARAISG